MNYAGLAQSEYRKTQKSSDNIIDDDPFILIELTLLTLLKSLRILSCNSISAEAKNLHISKSLSAIYLLQDSIDLDRGGEIAVNLLNVYEHCRLVLLEYISDKNDKKSVQNCVYLIETILEAWRECKDRQ